jgi:hypothetical protein
MDFIKTSYNAKNVTISGFQSHLENLFSTHISICNHRLL